jgi:hypothetical protein
VKLCRDVHAAANYQDHWATFNQPELHANGLCLAAAAVHMLLLLCLIADGSILGKCLKPYAYFHVGFAALLPLPSKGAYRGLTHVSCAAAGSAACRAISSTGSVLTDHLLAVPAPMLQYEGSKWRSRVHLQRVARCSDTSTEANC